MSVGHNSGIAEVQRKVRAYAAHLERITQAFNSHSRQLGLGIRLNPTEAIRAVQRGTGITRAIRYADRVDDSGVLHDAQLMTALDCIGELLTSPQRNGLVLGAMQSGKTTTSLALQFAGPIVYLLTARTLYPIYLITSHTSQEDQTKIEITRFLDFYGELQVEVDDEHTCTLIEYVRRVVVNPVFQVSPTINVYREQVLQRALPDTMMGPRLEDFIQRRAPGESIRRVADLCRRANVRGFSPLLIIDEPQFGASDRIVKTHDDEFERRPCVLLQIFDAIDAALGSDVGDRVFIGLSATPYELHDINSVWKINQYLTSAYSGFNFFGGKVIDADADVSPPRTLSFAQHGKNIDVSFFGEVDLGAYNATPQRFARFKRRTGYDGTQSQYRTAVENALRAAIMHAARSGSTPNTGICIRLFNDNIKSHRLIERLHLRTDEIEVIEYYGTDHKGRSVKRAIRERNHPELPFLIAVTNRARMGDAFPREVELFLEFSKKAANLNALLQGLLGRACGYGKQSTVVMSDENAHLVEDYKRKQGGYIYKTSRHSVIAGSFRRGAPTSLIRVSRDMNDVVVAEFFRRLDQEVVEPNVFQGTRTLRARRASGGQNFRTGPLLRIAEELQLFEHLESPEVRARLFPTYPEIHIVRRNESVPHSRDRNRMLRYTTNADGNCRFTFREWSEGGANHGGVRSRGLGQRDAADRDRAGDTLEPQVNMRKFDPATGKVIDDKRVNGQLMLAEERRQGHWRAEMVTLPLSVAVRELQAGEATYPVPLSPFSVLLSDEERSVRDTQARSA
jgi:hypothetical protein